MGGPASKDDTDCLRWAAYFGGEQVVPLITRKSRYLSLSHEKIDMRNTVPFFVRRMSVKAVDAPGPFVIATTHRADRCTARPEGRPAHGAAGSRDTGPARTGGIHLRKVRPGEAAVGKECVQRRPHPEGATHPLNSREVSRARRPPHTGEQERASILNFRECCSAAFHPGASVFRAY